jgi:hypothetical protein
VQAGRDAGRLTARQVTDERGDQPVAASPVDGPRPPQVAVELAALEEVGEGKLLDHRRAEVIALLGGNQIRGDAFGGDHPAEPQAGCERLRNRARIHHTAGREALDGADRRAVVAVLGVVVVLEHEPPAGGRPLDQGGAACRGEHHTRRELVGRCHDDGVERGRSARLEQLGAKALLVDRDRHGLEPGGRELHPRRPAPRLLEPDSPGAAPDQGAPEDRHALRHPRGHDHALGIARRSAHAAQVGGERAPELGRATRIAVVEAGVRGVAKRAAERSEPGAARKERDVRAAGAKVEAGQPLGRR